MAGKYIIHNERLTKTHNQALLWQGCYRIVVSAAPGTQTHYGAISTMSSNREPGKEPRIRPHKVTHRGHRYAVVVYPKKGMSE